MKTFVIGDIHGAYKALMQCLTLCGLDYHNDHLIVLGDVCDGYPQVRLCIEELLKIKNCSYILGNHDLWALDWALRGDKPKIWTSQGGNATILSYSNEPVPQEHIHFLQEANYWFEFQGKVFVHGGFDCQLPLDQQKKDELVWDRNLIQAAWKQSLIDNNYKFSQYEEIFLGHTPVQNFKRNEPLHLCNVWAIDTGAGWLGPLTIMDVHTKQYWQSQPTSKLYEGFRSR